MLKNILEKGLRKYFLFFKEDEFSENIFCELKSKLAFSEKKDKSTKDYEFYISENYPDCIFLYFKGLHLYLNTEDPILNQENAVYFFVSMHKSREGEPYFTVHLSGNYLAADYGGNKETLSYCDPTLKNHLIATYKKTFPEGAPKGFVEATHHGPYFKKPHLFIELGPDKDAWNNRKYIESYINWIEPLFSHKLKKGKDKGAVMLGGSHYFEFKDILDLEKKYDCSIGHICPKYILSQISEAAQVKKIIEEMVRKTLNCSLVLVNQSYVAKLSIIKAGIEEFKKEYKKKEHKDIEVIFF